MPPTPHPTARTVVLPATSADLPFVVSLQKAYHRALGFLPRAALDEKIRLGQVLLARTGRARAGFLHHGSPSRPEVRVFQLAVTRAAQGRGAGGALVDALLESAAGARGVSLRCLADLEANRFWKAVGFRLHATEPGARGTLNVWVRRIGSSPFHFVSRVHPCPACGAPTVDTWVRGARRLSLCAECVEAARWN
jgi:GNAT superfamily N-acetyltransferase